nr:MAG TPA: hypothetical protein [Bacteriophage sp.]
MELLKVQIIIHILLILVISIFQLGEVRGKY